MAGNIVLNLGSGGPGMATLEDASSENWIPSVICYATSTTQGSATFQFVGAANGLPVIVESGAITANAGTNLNTSALALEAGGNLAAIEAKVPALGQAVAAGSVPVVLTVAQLAALEPLTGIDVLNFPTGFLATQSGSWTVTANAGTGNFTVVQTTAANLNATVVGTGTFVCQASITSAIPAGTNLLGSIAEAPQIAAAFNGTTGLTIQYAPFTLSSPGTTTVVAAVSGKKVYLLRWSVSANAAATINFQSHTTTTLATGVRYLTQYASAGGAYCPVGIMATAAGEGLDIVFGGTGPISGEFTYVQF